MFKGRLLFKFAVLLCAVAACVLPFATVFAEDRESRVKIEEHTFENGEIKLSYLLYLPEDHNPDKSYRLVLFLHGAGDRGSDFSVLRKIDYGFITEYRENANYRSDTIVLVPQCPIPYLWVEDSWDTGAYTMTDTPSPAIAAVKELCDYVTDGYGVDESRIYAVGVSMGGMAVWDMLARYPELFAAAAPICGCVDESRIDEYAKTPIFTANDKRDTIVGAAPTVRVAERLKALGADVIYKEYDTDVREDVTHHSTWIDAFTLDKSTDNLYSFLFSHQREPADTTRGNNQIKAPAPLICILACGIPAAAALTCFTVKKLKKTNK